MKTKLKQIAKRISLLIHLFFVLFLLPSLNLQSQDYDCDNELLTFKQWEVAIKDIPLIEEFKNSSEKNVTTSVPVYFTVFRNDMGLNGHVTQTQVNTAINNLNLAFSGANLNFVQCGDINYIDNTTLNAGAIPYEDYSYISSGLNIYIHPSASTVASFPFDPAPNNWLSLQYPGYLTSSTVIHEIGHSYGLFHTQGQYIWNNPADSYSTPPYQDHPYNDNPTHGTASYHRELMIQQYDGTKDFPTPNSTYAGDLVSDTPPSCSPLGSTGAFSPDPTDPDCFQPNQNILQCNNGCTYSTSTCTYTGNAIDYNGDPITPLVNNHMSYFTSSCRTQFTSGQMTRAGFYNQNYRASQYDHTLCGSLEDYVEMEGSNKALDNVVMEFRHNNDSRYCNAFTNNSNGKFQGALYHNLVKANVFKLGTNSKGANYQYSDWTEGVSVLDKILIQQHIIGSNPLPDGYRKLAADVNKSGTISTIDLILIDWLIIGNRQSFVDWDAPWQFIPEYIPQDFTTSFNNDPFNMTVNGSSYSQEAPYLESNWEFSISNGNNGKSGFDAIKMGDVSGSILNSLAPELEPVSFYAPNVEIPNGTEFTISIKPSINAKVQGFQFGMIASPEYLQIIDIEFDRSENTISPNKKNNLHGQGLERGEIKVLWSDPQLLTMNLDKKNVLITVKLKARKDISNLLDVFNIDNDLLKSEFISENLIKLNLQLEGIISLDQIENSNNFEYIESNTIELDEFNCYPNPTTNILNLVFKSNKQSNGTILIHDSFGKRLFIKKEILRNGINNIELDISKFSPGLLFISIQDGEDIWVRKVTKI